MFNILAKTMNKKYLILFFIWLISVAAVGASIAIIRNSGVMSKIMAKFIVLNVSARPDCTVSESIEILMPAGGVFRVDPGQQDDCGSCSAAREGELVRCDTGGDGDCSGWAYEWCSGSQWTCFEDIE